MKAYVICGNDDYDGESTRAFALDEDEARGYADGMVAGTTVGPRGNTLSPVDSAVVYAVDIGEATRGAVFVGWDDRVYIARKGG